MSSIVSVYFAGRVGNVMFQVATAYAYALENNFKFELLAKSAYPIYNENLDLMDNLLKKFHVLSNVKQSWDVLKEKDDECLSYKKYPVSNSKYILFQGYFHIPLVLYFFHS